MERAGAGAQRQIGFSYFHPTHILAQELDQERQRAAAIKLRRSFMCKPSSAYFFFNTLQLKGASHDFKLSGTTATGNQFTFADVILLDTEFVLTFRT
jgi:hypothetical protein